MSEKLTYKERDGSAFGIIYKGKEVGYIFLEDGFWLASFSKDMDDDVIEWFFRVSSPKSSLGSLKGLQKFLEIHIEAIITLLDCKKS